MVLCPHLPLQESQDYPACYRNQEIVLCRQVCVESVCSFSLPTYLLVEASAVFFSKLV